MRTTYDNNYSFPFSLLRTLWWYKWQLLHAWHAVVICTFRFVSHIFLFSTHSQISMCIFEFLISQEFIFQKITLLTKYLTKEFFRFSSFRDKMVSFSFSVKICISRTYLHTEFFISSLLYFLKWKVIICSFKFHWQKDKSIQERIFFCEFQSRIKNFYFIQDN